MYVLMIVTSEFVQLSSSWAPLAIVRTHIEDVSLAMHGVRITLPVYLEAEPSFIRLIKMMRKCFPVTHSVLVCLTITASYTLITQIYLISLSLSLQKQHTATI